MGETQIFESVQKHLGTASAVCILLTLLAVRFLPAILQSIREKRMAILQAKQQAAIAISQREHDLFSRLDKKDEVLEKLTSNHIQHLEVQLAKNAAFYDTAVEHLRVMTGELKELRMESRDILHAVEQVKDLSHEIKGHVQ